MTQKDAWSDMTPEHARHWLGYYEAVGTPVGMRTLERLRSIAAGKGDLEPMTEIERRQRLTAAARVEASKVSQELRFVVIGIGVDDDGAHVDFKDIPLPIVVSVLCQATKAVQDMERAQALDKARKP